MYGYTAITKTCRHALSVMGLGAMCACAVPNPPVSQQEHVDPQAMMDHLLRDTEQDRQRERVDKAQERIRLQQEQAYDREMCLKAGKTGPDVDQCVRDSALFRRQGSLPSASRQPTMECVTIGDDEGGGITDCQ
jgi:hypothetical protein